jgi:CHAD domain-containing protein
VVTAFHLSDDTDLAALQNALGPAFALEAARARPLQRAYYESFDGRLHASGLSLAHEGGRLVLFDGDEERAAVPLNRAPRAIFATDLPAGALRGQLEPVADVRVLSPVARLRVTRQELRVLDELQKTVVRLRIEAPALREPAARLPRRLRVVGVRGYDREHRKVCELLERELELAPAGGSLAAEAVTRSGGRPEGVSSKPRVRLAAGEPAGVAAARICRRLACVIEDNLPGTLADTDTEFLHDLRVAVRRTRAVQRELRGVFPPGLEHFRSEFRRLQAITGPSRDLDVYVLEFDAFRAALPEPRRDDLGPLRDLLRRRRAKERRAMVRALRSDRTTVLLADWSRLLDALEAGHAGGPDARAPVEDLVRERIVRVHRRMIRDGGRIDDGTPAEALHDLRKRGKELRYLLELFGDLFPRKAVRPLVAALKDLQDTLGRHQDREVQSDLIASLAEEIRGDPDGAAALMAMGQLVDRLDRQKSEARAEFADRFAAFKGAMR